MTTLQPLYGFLTADLPAGSGSVSVDDPNLLRGTSQIAIVAPSSQRVEIMTVVGGSGTQGDPWTVSRAQRGTFQTDHYRGAKVQGINFTLTCNAVGGPHQDYTFRANDLVMESVSPGGDEKLTWNRFVADPVVVPSLGSQVVLSSQEGAIWTGVLEEPAPHFYPNGGADLSIEAVGYAHTLGDMPYTASKTLPVQGDLTGLTIAKIIRTGLSDLCLLISADYGHISAGGQGIQGKTGDLIGKTTQSLIGEYMPIGDAFLPLAYHVRSFGGDPTPKFELRLKASSPRYRVNIEDTVDGVTIHARRSDVYTTILLRWRDGVVPVTNQQALISIGQAQRGLYIDASSVISDLDTAESYANTLAAQLCAVRPKAGEVKLRYPKTVRDVGGALIAPWDVQPGEILQIYKGGVPLSSGNSQVPFTGGFYIRTRRFAFNGGELTLATSDEIAELARMITKLTLTEMTRTDSPTRIALGPQWTQPNSAAIPIPSPAPPSMRYATKADGNFDYDDLADGADTGSIVLSWSGGGGTDDPQAVAVGENADLALHTPTRIHTAVARVMPTDPANVPPQCTIQVYKMAVAVTPDTNSSTDGAISTTTPVLIDTITFDSTTAQQEVGSLGGWVLKKRREYKPAVDLTEDDWLLGVVTANPDPGGCRTITVTLRPQKTPGQSSKPPAAAGVAITQKSAQRGGTASPSAPTPGATFTIVTSDFARVRVDYGPPQNGSSTFTPSGYSPVSPLGKTHVIPVPPLPLTPIRWDITATDESGHVTTDTGNILF